MDDGMPVPSVHTYSPSVRVGNWNEDISLGEDMLKDFLEKKDNNQLLIQKSSEFLKTVLKPVELSSTSDGYLHFGDTVCLLHVPTQSVLSANINPDSTFTAKELQPETKMTCSKRVQPCIRNTFIIGSYDATGKDGEPVCYEQPIILKTLPNEGGDMLARLGVKLDLLEKRETHYFTNVEPFTRIQEILKKVLSSAPATFWEHSKRTREQELKLQKEEEVKYKCAWRLLCFNQADRLESAGMLVLANQMIFINHCKTNMHLAVHDSWTHKTLFGREFEVTACTKLNKHKVEESHNHFVIVTKEGHPSALATSTAAGTAVKTESKQ